MSLHFVSEAFPVGDEQTDLIPLLLLGTEFDYIGVESTV